MSKLEDYIASLVSEVESDPDFTARNKRLNMQLERRLNKNAPQIPAEFKKTASDFRSPFIFDVLRRAPGLTSTTMPVPGVTPLSTSDDAQTNSSLREEWLKAAYLKMDRDNRIYHDIQDSLSGDGCAVWKVIIDKHTWAAPDRKDSESDKEYLVRTGEHRNKHFPFYWEHVPVSTFYPFYDENGLSEVLQITEQSATRLARRHKISKTGDKWVKNQKGEVPAGPVKHIEYWSRTEFAYMVETLVVKKGEHTYRRPPYFIAPLTVVSGGNPVTDFYGLAWPMLHLQDLFDSLTTAELNWVMLNCFPYPVLEPLGDNAIPLEGETGKIELIRGQVFSPPPGYRLVWMQPPNASANINALRELIKNTIDQVGLAPVLFGDFPSDTSGTAANTMVAVAKSIFGPGLNNMAKAFDDMAGFIQEQVELLDDNGKGVPVWMQTDQGAGKYVTLSKKDIKGYYEVHHTLEPVIPAEQQMRYMYLADAQARGFVTQNHVREAGMNITNPEQMADAVWVEQAEKDPRVQQVIMQKALEPYLQQTGSAGSATQQMAGAGTPPNMPVSVGGPGAQVAPGINAGMMPGQRVATRPSGMGGGG